MPEIAGGLDFGRYQLGEMLGRGGMGEVYRAHDVALERDVAIKFVATDKLADLDARARLLREARAAAGLDHPGICQVYEAGDTTDGRAFIVMQLLEGRPLSEVLAMRGPLPVREALTLGVQIAEALGAAHRRGIVHRDLKPSNVMVDASGRARLMDFGIAKVIDAVPAAADLSTVSANTTGHAIVGTPAYMAPEQVQQRPLDGRADLFALGVVLYECLTGTRLFDAPTPVEIVANVLKVDPPLASTLRKELSDRHDALCQRLLAKEPADRFQSADEVVGAIRLLLQDTSRITDSLILKRPGGVSRWAPWLFLATAAVAGLMIWRIMRPPGLPPVPANAQRWYERGTEALREGSYQQARTNLEEATRLFKDYAFAYVRLAEADIELDDEGAAKTRLLRFSALVPDESRLPDDERLRVQAVRSLMLHDPEAAVAGSRELASRHPDDPGVWVDLGRAQEAEGLRSDAAQSYERAIAVDRQYAVAHLRLGFVESAALHFDKAMSAFGEAERLYTAAASSEGLTEVLLRRGAALDANGRSEPARKDLERALSLANSSNVVGSRVRVLLALSSVLATEGQFSKAEEMASGAVRTALSAKLDTIAAEGLTDLAGTLADKDHVAEAANQLNHAIQLATERDAKRTLARARLQLAEVRRMSGAPGDALGIVNDVLPLVQANKYRRLELTGLLIAASCHQDLGQLEQARQTAASVLDVADSLHDEERTALAASELSQFAASLGDYAKALVLRERAEAIYRRLGNQRDLPYALANHADLLIRLGRTEDAGRVLAELDAGIAKGLDAYVGRLRRVTLLRGLAAATEMRCDVVRRTLAEADESVSLDARSLLTPALLAFCEALGAERPRTVGPAPAAADPVLAAERDYWVGMSKLAVKDFAGADAAATEGLGLLAKVPNEETRWRLAAVAAAAANGRKDAGVARERLDSAAKALATTRQQLGEESRTYDSRRDLSYLRKLAGLT